MPPAKVAVVTEVSSPVMAAAARRLAEGGAEVVVFDSAPGRARAATAGWRQPVTVVESPRGVCGPDEAALIARTAIDRHGGIDALVLGFADPAPIAWPGPSGGSLFTAASAPLQAWIDCLEAALPGLERSAGRVVSVVSSAGRYRSGYFRPERAVLSSAPQALAGGAILGLTRQMALELAPRIRLNAVVVGLVEGASDLDLMTDEERRFVLEEISLGRPAAAEEVAAAIEFLALDASNYLTGDALDVNGGWWMS